MSGYMAGACDARGWYAFGAFVPRKTGSVAPRCGTDSGSGVALRPRKAAFRQVDILTAGLRQRLCRGMYDSISRLLQSLRGRVRAVIAQPSRLAGYIRWLTFHGRAEFHG